MKVPLTWHEASSAEVNSHRWLRWKCVPFSRWTLAWWSFVFSHHRNAREHMQFPRVTQLCHVRSLESNRLGGVFILGFYIWNVRISVICVTFTLLPFEKSGWHQNSCSVYSVLLTSILALEGNMKNTNFYIKAFFCCIENQVFFWWLVWTNAELSPSENIFFIIL